MAVRNMEKTASKAIKNIPTAYDLSVEELYRLYDLMRKDKTEALLMAFRYGFVLGTRAIDKKQCKKPL